MWRYQICGVLLLIVLMIQAKKNSKPKVYVEFSNATYKIINSELIKSAKVTMLNVKQMSFEIMYNHNVNDFKVLMRIGGINGNSIPVNVIKFEFDGCKILENEYDYNLVRIIFLEALRGSNFPKKCPLMANVLYAVHNYTLHDEYFQALRYDISWHILFQFLVEKVPSLKIEVTGRFYMR